MWLAFLDTITAGNQALIAFLQRAIGYSLTGIIRDHVLFILYGVGANGKSTFLSVLGALLEDYAQVMPPETQMLKKQEGHPTEIARLRASPPPSRPRGAVSSTSPA